MSTVPITELERLISSWQTMEAEFATKAAADKAILPFTSAAGECAALTLKGCRTSLARLIKKHTS